MSFLFLLIWGILLDFTLSWPQGHRVHWDKSKCNSQYGCQHERLKFHIQTVHGITSKLFPTTIIALVLGVLQSNRALFCILFCLSKVQLIALSPSFWYPGLMPYYLFTSQLSRKDFGDTTDLWLTCKSSSPNS